MNKFVVDTMAFILRLERRKMPKKILEKFEQAEKGQIKIIVPAMVFAELAYLSKKKNRHQFKRSDGISQKNIQQ